MSHQPPRRTVVYADCLMSGRLRIKESSLLPSETPVVVFKARHSLYKGLMMRTGRDITSVFLTVTDVRHGNAD